MNFHQSGRHGFVYVTACLVNGKQYVGQHIGTTKNYLGSGRILCHAIKKYGRESFCRDILQHCYSLIELNAAERYWIKTLNTKSPAGYNLTDGGEGMPNPSPEVRAKIVAHLYGNSYAKGNRLSDATRERMRVAHTGKPRPKHSEETKRKLSEAAKRHWGQPDHVNPMSRPEVRARHLEIKHSEEHRKRLSVALLRAYARPEIKERCRAMVQKRERNEVGQWL